MEFSDFIHPGYFPCLISIRAGFLKKNLPKEMFTDDPSRIFVQQMLYSTSSHASESTELHHFINFATTKIRSCSIWI